METAPSNNEASNGTSALDDGLAVFPVPAFLRQSARKSGVSKMFAVVLRLQEPEITARCYGKECGRGIFAALFDDDLGALVPCAQEECPHLDKQTDEPLWKDGEGRDVYLRRLRTVTANVELTGAAAGLLPQCPATEGSEVERRVVRQKVAE